MKINSSYLAAATLTMLGVASPIYAFSFTSDFTSPNWVSSGDVLRISTTASLSNARSDGSDDVMTSLNFSGTDPTSAGGPLEAFLGISVGDLDIGGEAQEGSAISQTFDAAAGEILSFDLNIPNFDGVNPDLVFVIFNGNLTTFSSSTTVIRNLVAGVNTNTISIGVVDINDSIVSSQAVISNAEVTPIPFEFSPAIGLGLLGVGGVIAKLRKNKKKS